MSKKRNIKTNSANNFFKALISMKMMPYLMAFSILGIMFVLVRMKGVEQSYRYNAIKAQFDETNIENKQVKAKKAKLLNIKNMRQIAQKYELKEPTNKQVIVIP